MGTGMCKLLFIPMALKLLHQLPCCSGEGRAEGLLMLVGRGSSPMQGVWVPLTLKMECWGQRNFRMPARMA